MKQKHTLTIMSGVLLVSAALIAGLANANITTNRKDKSMMYVQKLDTNQGGAISLDELTTRQDRQFDKLDHDKNGMIAKHEFNARLITMFHRMDRNGDGVLRDNELPDHSHGGKKHQRGNKAPDCTKTAEESLDAISLNCAGQLILPKLNGVFRAPIYPSIPATAGRSRTDLRENFRSFVALKIK